MNAETPRSYEPVDVKKNQKLQALLQSNGVTVRKKAETLGRKPRANEIGGQMTTYVRKSPEDWARMQAEGYADESYEVEGGVIVVESRSPITDDRVVSRNPAILGVVNNKPMYNEWTQPAATWLKNYGVEPDTEFAPYKKVATTRVLKVDGGVMEILCGDPSASSADIAVDWAPGTQQVYKGGYIADAGYGLEQGEYDRTYEVVEEKPSHAVTDEQEGTRGATSDVFEG